MIKHYSFIAAEDYHVILNSANPFDWRATNMYATKQ